MSDFDWVYLFGDGRYGGDWVPLGPSYWDRAELLASIQDLGPYEFLYISPPPNVAQRLAEKVSDCE